jgi:hypothetical protein
VRKRIDDISEPVITHASFERDGKYFYGEIFEYAEEYAPTWLYRRCLEPTQEEVYLLCRCATSEPELLEYYNTRSAQRGEWRCVEHQPGCWTEEEPEEKDPYWPEKVPCLPGQLALPHCAHTTR